MASAEAACAPCADSATSTGAAAATRAKIIAGPPTIKTPPCAGLRRSERISTQFALRFGRQERAPARSLTSARELLQFGERRVGRAGALLLCLLDETVETSDDENRRDFLG